MAFPIPRIQYKNVDTTGTTASGNATISGIADTSDIEVGMFVRGTGVPTGATVGSKTSTTMTLASGTCSASATVSLAFGYEILFTYPPVEPTGESYETKATSTEALSGEVQTAVNYVEAKRKLEFSFLSPTQKTAMDTFVSTCALLGNAFRYYEDQSSSTYTEYELDALKYEPKKIAPRSTTTFSWKIPLAFRRVL